MHIVLECLRLGAWIIKNTKIHMCPFLKIYPVMDLAYTYKPYVY